MLYFFSSFESQLQEWLLMTPPEQTSVTTATRSHAHDYTPSWGTSLQSRLELLKARIKVAKWEGKVDSMRLKTLTTTNS